MIVGEDAAIRREVLQDTGIGGVHAVIDALGLGGAPIGNCRFEIDDSDNGSLLPQHLHGITPDMIETGMARDRAVVALGQMDIILSRFQLILI
jgi:hypothetical protein